MAISCTGYNKKPGAKSARFSPLSIVGGKGMCDYAKRTTHSIFRLGQSEGDY
ncbi:hypothetical protein F751_0406 [Auxenochlorella protothecoides]|uniref:Uncharacterized protein n=1 Tax=Auxenochlorella protothecoides TaxID=3075 RepID=A0A087SBB8_AUXPR|nr:hypothetical protein F751_0406 [Auxenochlorella protothecoides]KFM23022.1 hypothetical protein F751_0406 [Auxenochlorella protothecoides]